MIEELKARIAELERQLENERIRLAACGSAALGYFEGCKDEYKSASLDDVLRLRKRVDLLERQLAESRDFAISEAAKIYTSYERQQALLVEALRLGTSVLHEYPGGEICLCSQCEFVRARAKALAAVKGATP